MATRRNRPRSPDREFADAISHQSVANIIERHAGELAGSAE